jgi:inward rectifier potassium channel
MNGAQPGGTRKRPLGRPTYRDGRLAFRVIGGTGLHPADFYHRVLNSSWLLFLSLMGGSFVLLNAAFATLYILGGDCIGASDPKSFFLAFSFSVQTLASIGYGGMAPTTMWAHGVSDVEAFVGMCGLALWTGLFFARFSRPTSRVRFSNKAIIRTRDGIDHLLFRVSNERGNLLVEAKLSVAALIDEVTAEGDKMRRLVDLPLIRDRTPLFSLSWVAMHPITPDSPLHGLSPDTIQDHIAAIIASLTGLDDTLHQTVHAQRAYASSEIVWGHRFVDMLERGPDGVMTVYPDRIDEIAPDDAGGPQDKPAAD